MQLLSGLPAGRPNERGRYPEGSFNGLVAHRLRKMAQRAKEFGRGGQHRGEDKPSGELHDHKSGQGPG
jgi:hypothetical protein